jgi:Leucine-rich repeat (LRR) protein
MLVDGTIEHHPILADFLKSPTGLKSLCLANNSLSSIDPKVLSHLKLNEIDLSYNEFTKLSANLMEALSSVEVLKLQGNKMFTIDSSSTPTEYKLQRIFLADNQFTVITGSMLEKFTKL